MNGGLAHDVSDTLIQSAYQTTRGGDFAKSFETPSCFGMTPNALNVDKLETQNVEDFGDHATNVQLLAVWALWPFWCSAI